MDNISNNISYKEATKSSEAIKFGIKNKPSEEELSNMKDVAENIFEPLRKHFGNKPIYISSFFRSVELNKKISNSSSTSQHCLGMAMDIDADYFNNGITNLDIFNYIKDNLEFDQLIKEFPIKGEPSWIHVSYNKAGNRKKCMVSYHKNNRVIYENC